MYKHLENKMCKELAALEEKYRTGAEMSEGDLRRIDLLAHSLKSLATFAAMKEAEEMQSGNSYMGGNSYNSYNSYSRGGNMSMNGYPNRDMRQDMSGHYPPYYPEERRW